MIKGNLQLTCRGTTSNEIQTKREGEEELRNFSKSRKRKKKFQRPNIYLFLRPRGVRFGLVFFFLSLLKTPSVCLSSLQQRTRYGLAFSLLA